MTEKTFLQRQWLTIRRQIKPAVVFVAALWICETVDALLPPGWSLDQWGIRPREPDGLAGIAFAPFLHEGFLHLAKNTVPLLILGWLVLLSGRWLFIGLLLVTGLSSGLGVWIFGSGTVHIGASGIIFGMLGFLLARGWVARRLGWTLISLLVGLLYYGNVFNGLLPDPHVSWSSHFWGLTGGAGFAWWLYRHKGLPAPVPGVPGGTRLMRKSRTLLIMKKSKALLDMVNR
ncbi:MAG: rhomboid family intramembrane serine protease [Verrucomicrobiota bacterium]